MKQPILERQTVLLHPCAEGARGFARVERVRSFWRLTVRANGLPRGTADAWLLRGEDDVTRLGGAAVLRDGGWMLQTDLTQASASAARVTALLVAGERPLLFGMLPGSATPPEQARWALLAAYEREKRGRTANAVLRRLPEEDPRKASPATVLRDGAASAARPVSPSRMGATRLDKSRKTDVEEKDASVRRLNGNAKAAAQTTKTRQERPQVAAPGAASQPAGDPPCDPPHNPSDDGSNIQPYPSQTGVSSMTTADATPENRRAAYRSHGTPARDIAPTIEACAIDDSEPCSPCAAGTAPVHPSRAPSAAPSPPTRADNASSAKERRPVRWLRIRLRRRHNSVAPPHVLSAAHWQALDPTVYTPAYEAELSGGRAVPVPCGDDGAPSLVGASGMRDIAFVGTESAFAESAGGMAHPSVRPTIGATDAGKRSLADIVPSDSFADGIGERLYAPDGDGRDAGASTVCPRAAVLSMAAGGDVSSSRRSLSSRLPPGAYAASDGENRVPSGGRALGTLPALAWPPSLRELAPHFARRIPDAPFDLPMWRFVRVPLQGGGAFAAGVLCRDAAVRRVMYALPGARQMRPPDWAAGYRWREGRDGGYWTSGSALREGDDWRETSDRAFRPSNDGGANDGNQAKAFSSPKRGEAMEAR